MTGVVLAASGAGLLFMVTVDMAGAEASPLDRDRMLFSAAERNEIAEIRRLVKEGAGL